MEIMQTRNILYLVAGIFLLVTFIYFQTTIPGVSIVSLNFIFGVLAILYGTGILKKNTSQVDSAVSASFISALILNAAIIVGGTAGFWVLLCYPLNLIAVTLFVKALFKKEHRKWVYLSMIITVVASLVIYYTFLFK